MTTSPVEFLNAASSSAELSHTIDQFSIAQNYFSDILNAQLVIFSLIVGSFIALYFFLNVNVRKQQVKDEVDKHFAQVKDEVSKDLNEKMKALESMFTVGMNQQAIENHRMNGRIYRTLGEFWDSEKQYQTAFIWWFRAGHQFVLAGSDTVARICLNSAKTSLDSTSSALSLSSDSIGEFQKLLPEIPEQYRIEKELLESALKATLNKKET